ncbi:ArsR/SmtB family transcription factor [Streptomyces sp. NPDC058157]|uniref:ArsR/SmtB family transcription factor n=1 Tax=Streptomyces sp. NPDC058157 TaxID=3346360 RepID=UPI0036E37BE1
MLSEDDARVYAGWFKALADPTRVRLLHLLAGEGRAMSVGEIVERAEVGQSTVSHHLKILAEVRFVLAERQSTSTLYTVNRTCQSVFPRAVSAILGEEAPAGDC